MRLSQASGRTGSSRVPAVACVVRRTAPVAARCGCGQVMLIGSMQTLESWRYPGEVTAAIRDHQHHGLPVNSYYSQSPTTTQGDALRRPWQVPPPARARPSSNPPNPTRRWRQMPAPLERFLVPTCKLPGDQLLPRRELVACCLDGLGLTAVKYEVSKHMNTSYLTTTN